MSSVSEAIKLSVILPLAEIVYGSCATKWYHRICEMNTWEPERIKKWQEINLISFISHAYFHTKYYRELFDSISLKPEDIKCIEDLKKIPVVTKKIILSRYDDFIPDNLSDFKYRNADTGGTNGDPMKYLCDENVWGYVTAAKIFNWKKTGYRYGEAFVALGSSTLFSERPSFMRRIYDRIRNEHGLNSMNMDDSLCAQYVEYISKKRIKYIYGYASSIFLLADYALRSGINLEIKAIFTTSENLTDTYRKTIFDAFHCKIMDCYGAKDAGITAYEKNQGCYPLGYNAIVETVDETTLGTGTLLTTNFLNYCFPLIRYDFGDFGTIDNNPSPSEYNGQVLRKIWGRTSDVIRLGNGHVLTGPGFTVMMGKLCIKSFELKQNNDSEITLFVVKDDGFDNEQDMILRKELYRFVGEGCKVNVSYVDRMEEMQNGKRRFYFVGKES